MRWKRMKFGWDRKVELKQSFEPDHQILLKVLTNVGTNFIRFCMDESEWNEAKS